jgi:threonine/homoserine efflux transporter RhtA
MTLCNFVILSSLLTSLVPRPLLRFNVKFSVYNTENVHVGVAWGRGCLQKAHFTTLPQTVTSMPVRTHVYIDYLYGVMLTMLLLLIYYYYSKLPLHVTVTVCFRSPLIMSLAPGQKIT